MDPNLKWRMTSTSEEKSSKSGNAVTRVSELENDAGYVTKEEISVISQDKFYEHNQISPSLTWIINHNLGKYPSVTITDSAGTQVIGDVKHESINKVTISFSAQFAGKAFLN